MALLPTKYARQRATASARIKAKGTTCTWVKVAVAANDPTVPPEFAPEGEPTPYPDTPILLYTADRSSLATQIAEAVTGQVTNQTYALLAGDVPFRPAVDDEVLFTDGTVRVCASVNTTQPDNVPIIYEVTFK